MTTIAMRVAKAAIAHPVGKVENLRRRKQTLKQIDPEDPARLMLDLLNTNKRVRLQF
jgi:hypothetical protein